MSDQDEDPVRTGDGERRRLDHAPGERYLTGTPASPSRIADGPARGVGSARPRQSVAVAAVVALAGSLTFFALGQLDLGPGLLAVAAFAGWITAVALVAAGAGGDEAGHRGPARIAGAAVLAGGAIVLAMGLDWAWAMAQGGVLGPLDYAAARYGPAALADIGIAGAVAALRAR